jgi:NAD(P)-dependent dehydrogenase (short-subunit alcohol dehydrogenase family)
VRFGESNVALGRRFLTLHGTGVAYGSFVFRRNGAPVMDLEDKIALVTGAGSGIGAATALALADAGADVVVVSRTAGEIDKVAQSIHQRGRKAIAVAADVADEKAVAKMFRRIERNFGRLDFVFANAGVNGVWAPIEELKPAEWDETIRINLRGTYLTVHHAVPLMKKQGGSIAITASINGTRTFSTAGASAYSTTKAGQLALGQRLALELAKYRIR